MTGGTADRGRFHILSPKLGSQMISEAIWTKAGQWLASFDPRCGSNVSGYDVAELLELADQALAQAALPVELAVDGRIAQLIASARDDRDDVLVAQGLEKPGRRTGIVRDDGSRLPA